MQLKHCHLYTSEHGVMLSLLTQKTGTTVHIPLPGYAISVIERYKGKCGKFLLPRLSSTNINLQVKQIIESAGWTQPLQKIRYRMGRPVEVKHANGQSFRFCDHITAHTMRRTAITTLLMLGVPEMIVRKVSGHAAGSREFYRYVCLVQDYLNEEVKQAHYRLINER